MPDDTIDLDAARRQRLQNRAKHALPLRFFSQMDAVKPKSWLIKQVLAKGEISSWIGAPGSAKSALLTDLAVHVAGGEDWRGYRSKGSFGVVYFALERASLVQRRLTAYRSRDQLPLSTPLAVADRIIDLLNPQCINTILATLAAAEDGFGMGVGLIIIDTFNKGIAAAGGDEDKARDQNRIAGNMRRILERRDLHIAGVGHTGKDATRGERGSNARLGDVDLRVIITGETIKTATIDKANDQTEGEMTSFGMEAVELGRDEDDEPITTGILSPIRQKAEKAAAKAPISERELMRRAIMKTFFRLVDDIGVHAVGLDGKSVHAVPLSRLKDDLIARGHLEVIDGKMPANARSLLRHAKAGLIHDGKLIEKDAMIWAP
jgi:hypothetical protein